MKKRIEPTLVEKAIETFEGFDLVSKKPGQQVILQGQSIPYAGSVKKANCTQ